MMVRWSGVGLPISTYKPTSLHRTRPNGLSLEAEFGPCMPRILLILGLLGVMAQSPGLARGTARKGLRGMLTSLHVARPSRIFSQRRIPTLYTFSLLFTFVFTFVFPYILLLHNRFALG